jgi:hypothetical protein
MSYYPGYPYHYPYGGYPYGGYPYGYSYPYYSVPSLINDYKLNGLYNELDGLRDVESQDAISSNRELHVDMSMSGLHIDTSLNLDLHGQLKIKNAELVQHIVGKNKEINDLKELLKKNNIEQPTADNDFDCSMNPRYFFPHRPFRPFRPYRPYGPYRPHYPYHPHPFWSPHLYNRDMDEEEIAHMQAIYDHPASQIIIPRAIAPDSPDHIIHP